MSNEFYREVDIAGYCPYLIKQTNQGQLENPGADCWQLQLSNSGRPLCGQLPCPTGGKTVTVHEPPSQSYKAGRNVKIFINCQGCQYQRDGFSKIDEVGPPLPLNPDAPQIRR